MTQKLDILVFAAHPDDAELGCSGTIIKHIQQGKRVGIVDLTRGELGTRGTEEIRARESEASSGILGITARSNAGLPDGFLEAHKEYCLELIKYIRFYQPEIVLCNALEDRHPDHGKASELASRSCFLSGLQKIETHWNGDAQTQWRPKNVYHYIQDRYINPDFVVDISEQWQGKLASIKAYSSQFYTAGDASTEPQTYISGKIFLDYVEARAREFGHAIGVEFGEGFTREKQIGVKDLFDLI